MNISYFLLLVKKIFHFSQLTMFKYSEQILSNFQNKYHSDTSKIQRKLLQTIHNIVTFNLYTLTNKIHMSIKYCSAFTHLLTKRRLT